MKNTKCECCASNDLRDVREDERNLYDKDIIIEHTYICNSCKFSGIKNVKDWRTENHSCKYCEKLLGDEE